MQSPLFLYRSTYGVVLKARHKETGQFVAIKKIKESDKDEQVRKTALREVRILKVCFGCWGNAIASSAHLFFHPSNLSMITS